MLLQEQPPRLPMNYLQESYVSMYKCMNIYIFDIQPKVDVDSVRSQDS